MLTVQIDSQAAEEGMRVVAKGLKALCQVHPFIGAAVISFNAVVILHLKRRENDKKLLAVHARMQDALSVLFHLRKMKHSQELGEDGISVEQRMVHLMSRIDKEIQETGSICDHYRKKNHISKMVKATIYEQRFAEKATLFIQYREELLDALSLHTALGIDAANSKLDRQQEQLGRMENKLDEMLNFFRRLDTPQERDAREFIENIGGPEKCVDSDEHVTELMNLCGDGPSMARVSAADIEAALAGTKQAILKELDEDLDNALQRHMQLFERKLDVQRQELEETIKTSERNILAAMQAGAHERIRDEDLRAVWKEMNWKGSVKARHFVLALHDHYNDDLPTNKSTSELPRPSTGPDFLKEDKWALSYINISHVQPILEAFDDDGTGFITIKEVNAFVDSRPEGWTLPHWIAYWAAGWHVSIDKYKHRIYRLIQDMIKCAREVLPENRRSVDQYLSHLTFDRIELLLRSTRSLSHTFSADRYLIQATDAYTESEEKRLVRALDGMAYELDTPETVSLVTGPGRIERFIFPLIYLLMKRQHTIISLAKEYILDPDELITMSTTLHSVFEVLDDRIEGLASLFRQAHADIRGRFGNFAFGMLQLSYDIDVRVRDPKHNTLCTWQPPRNPYHHGFVSTVLDEQLQDPLSVLKHQPTLSGSIADSDVDIWHLGCICDSCSKEIIGDRVICLDCMSENYADNVNLCSRCCTKITLKGSFTHTPNHLMMKLKCVALDAELAWMIPKARAMDERMKLKAPTNDVDSKSQPQSGVLTRTKTVKRRSGSGVAHRCCRFSLQNPRECWVCFDCSRETFICNDCERRGVSVTSEHDSSMHTLLKMSRPTAVTITTEARLLSLESRMDAIEAKLGNLEKMEGKLASLEVLLREVLASKAVSR
ncbi:hypothetical protein WG66_011217 [Moniliophthora roreri]|nr:hypothetical protein WG66_011217 [Moniliophthora roreri]